MTVPDDTIRDDGWDSRATVVDGRWLDRTPRRPDAMLRLLTETRVLPWLAPQLPLGVPGPFVLREAPLVVRHALIAGQPLDDASASAAAHGAALGAFLRALHAVDAEAAAAHGAPGAAVAAHALGDDLTRMRMQVVPLLPRGRSAAGRALLDAVAAPPPAVALVHGDLGPEHVLVRDGRIAGVIDWSDAHVGDPALDLAWALHGTPAAFAAALAAAYGPAADALRSRAMAWHRLGPWYEVLHGLALDEPAVVASGLRGVLARL